MVESNLARKKERAGQEDHIWSAVILATNSPAPKAPPAELVEAEPKLKRVFGYNQFEVVGSSTELIDEENEHWLTPGKSFSLSVNTHRPTASDGVYSLNLQLFQEKRSLVKTNVRLAPGSPLYIRGPECGKGLIIFILKVVEPKH